MAVAEFGHHYYVRPPSRFSTHKVRESVEMILQSSKFGAKFGLEAYRRMFWAEVTNEYDLISMLMNEG